PGNATLRLTVPPAALTRLELSGLPSGARTEGALASSAEEGGPRVAFYAAGATASIGWNPRPRATAATPDAARGTPGETRREPLLSAETETSHSLDEGALETVTRIEYRVLQAPCGQFVLRFPQGSTLLAVEGAGVLRLPTAEPDGPGWQRATVELR